MKKVVIVLLALVAGSCITDATRVCGQEARATLGGRVLDATGGVVPGADVVVLSDDTGVKQQTVTNDEGNWVVQFLIPGNYSFSISVPGFKTAERKGLTLQAADNKQIDVQLEIGEVPRGRPG